MYLRIMFGEAKMYELITPSYHDSGFVKVKFFCAIHRFIHNETLQKTMEKTNKQLASKEKKQGDAVDSGELKPTNE